MSNLTPASGTEDHVVPNKPNIKKSITTGAHTNKNVSILEDLSVISTQCDILL
jgi:hypothetical protein